MASILSSAADKVEVAMRNIVDGAMVVVEAAERRMSSLSARLEDTVRSCDGDLAYKFACGTAGVFLLAGAAIVLKKSLCKRKRKRVLGVIPSTFKSTRFPGKPLVMLLGTPMIQHIYEEAKQATTLDRLVVATDNDKIYSKCKEIGADVVIVSGTCDGAISQCHEAACSLMESYDIIVYIHGDEPLLKASVIDDTVRALKQDDSSHASTAAAFTAITIPTATKRDEPSKNVVAMKTTIKCATDMSNNALYFSRSVVPCSRKMIVDPSKKYLLSQGVCCIDSSILSSMCTSLRKQPCPLSSQEAIDELWMLELGFRVKVVISDDIYKQHTVDGPQDIAMVEKLMRQ